MCCSDVQASENRSAVSTVQRGRALWVLLGTGWKDDIGADAKDCDAGTEQRIKVRKEARRACGQLSNTSLSRSPSTIPRSSAHLSTDLAKNVQLCMDNLEALSTAARPAQGPASRHVLQRRARYHLAGRPVAAHGPQQLASERVPPKIAAITASCTKKMETWRAQGSCVCCRPCCELVLDRDDVLGPWLGVGTVPAPEPGPGGEKSVR